MFYMGNSEFSDFFTFFHATPTLLLDSKIHPVICGKSRPQCLQTMASILIFSAQKGQFLDGGARYLSHAWRTAQTISVLFLPKYITAKNTKPNAITVKLLFSSP